MPGSRGRRVAVLSHGAPPTGSGNLDSRYDISDIDNHARVRGVGRGLTAKSVLKAIIEADPRSTHVLGYEKREVSHGQHTEVPGISRQDSLRKKQKRAKKVAKSQGKEPVAAKAS
jgi:hypothetical protein